jgi:hypothetical protein
LVVAEGHIPTNSEKLIDPKVGPVLLALKPHDLDRRDPALVLRGRVLDEDGKPVPGAIVQPAGFRKGSTGLFGRLPGFDALAVTDDRGEFRIGVPEKEISVFLKVTARFLAPQRPDPIVPGPMVHVVKLFTGVTVTGRVLRDGKPVAGVTLGLVQQSRDALRFLGEREIATDEKGWFRFENVPPEDAYFVYGLMHSFRPVGALPVRALRVGASGTEKDVGNLTVEAGHRLAGMIVLSDGKPITPDTRVLISRDQARDSQTVLVGADGSFTFMGLPAERYHLSVNVPGYRVSPKNGSFDLRNYGGLVGLVTQDVVGLRVLLEPGPRLHPDPKDRKKRELDFKEYRLRSEAPLRGMQGRAIPKGKVSNGTSWGQEDGWFGGLVN